MRIAIHTQHFVGVGHHVRSSRLARAFCQVPGSPHEVLVFDGGRPFSKAGVRRPGDTYSRVQLPPLVRGRAGLETPDPDQSLAVVLAERQARLIDGLFRLQPDLFLVESFPFSRWALREEIFAGILQARASNKGVWVVCSIRDVPRASQERNGSSRHGWDSQRGRPWPIQPADDRLDMDSAAMGTSCREDGWVPRIRITSPGAAFRIAFRVSMRGTGHVLPRTSMKNSAIFIALPGKH